MLKMTPAAATALAAARSEIGAPDTYGVRFFASTDQTGGRSRFGFDFVSRPEPNDAVTEESGLKAYVSPEVTSLVGEATVDVEKSDDGARLVLRRPATDDGAA